MRAPDPTLSPPPSPTGSAPTKRRPGRLRPAIVTGIVALAVGASIGGIVTSAVATAQAPAKITTLEHAVAAYQAKLDESAAKLDESGAQLTEAQAQLTATQGAITQCQAVEASLRGAAGEMDAAYRKAVAAAMTAKNSQDVVGGLLKLGATFD